MPTLNCIRSANGDRRHSWKAATPRSSCFFLTGKIPFIGFLSASLHLFHFGSAVGSELRDIPASAYPGSGAEPAWIAFRDIPASAPPGC
eukprot:5627761-Pyramimonas_sp.AAC.1